MKRLWYIYLYNLSNDFIVLLFKDCFTKNITKNTIKFHQICFVEWSCYYFAISILVLTNFKRLGYCQKSKSQLVCFWRMLCTTSANFLCNKFVYAWEGYHWPQIGTFSRVVYIKWYHTQYFLLLLRWQYIGIRRKK